MEQKIYIYRGQEIKASTSEEAKAIYNKTKGIKTLKDLRGESRNLITKRINENILKLTEATKSIKYKEIYYSDKIIELGIEQPEVYDMNDRVWSNWEFISKQNSEWYEVRKFTIGNNNTQRRTHIWISIGTYGMDKEITEKIKKLNKHIINSETKEEYLDWFRNKEEHLKIIDTFFKLIINETSKNKEKFISQKNNVFKEEAEQAISKLRVIEKTLKEME